VVSAKEVAVAEEQRESGASTHRARDHFHPLGFRPSGKLELLVLALVIEERDIIGSAGGCRDTVHSLSTVESMLYVTYTHSR
jgi:hypothetical protein